MSQVNDKKNPKLQKPYKINQNIEAKYHTHVSMKCWRREMWHLLSVEYEYF